MKKVIISLCCVLVLFDYLHGQQLELTLQTGHAGRINQIRFDPTNNLIASGGTDNLVILWDVKASRQLASYYLHQAPVNDLDFHPEKKWMASGSDDQTVKIWEYPSGNLIASIDQFSTPVKCVRFSPDGNYLLVATKYLYKIHLNDSFVVETSGLEATGEFNALAISPNQKYIACGGIKEKRTKVVDFQSYELVDDFQLVAKDLQFGAVDDLLFGAGKQKLVRRRVTRNTDVGIGFSNYADIRWHSYNAVAATDKLLIGAAKNDLIQVFDARKPVKKYTLKAHLDEINTLALSNDGKILASAGIDRYIVLWDLEKGEMIRPIYGFLNQVNTLDFSEDGSNVYIGYTDGSVRAWNLEDHSMVRNQILSKKKRTSGRLYRYNYVIDSLRKVPNGEQVALYTSKVKEVKEKVNQNIVPVQWLIKLFNKKKDVTVRSTPNSGIWEVKENTYSIKKVKKGEFFNPLQRKVVSDQLGDYYAQVGVDNQLMVKRGGEILFQVPTEHKNGVSVVKFNPAFDYLVTGSWDGTIRVWDKTSGALKLTLMAIGESDFLYLDPGNYYFVSKSALDGVGLRYENKVYPLAQFDLLYNRPDRVLGQLPYASESLLTSYERAYQKRLEKMGFANKTLEPDLANIPKVEIVNRAALPIVTQENKVALQIRASDAGSRLNRLNVYVNGVPNFGARGIDLGSTPTQETEKLISLPLSKGNNRIQIIALNEAGVQSVEETIDITYQVKKPEDDNLFLIAIGVSNYQEANKNLKYAAKDALDIAELYQSVEGFKEKNIKTLTDAQVTKASILALKEWLMTNTQVDDQVLLYVSGHGLLDDNYDFYYATHDISFTNPSAQGILYDDIEGLLDGIPARKKLLLIDACHSGEYDSNAPLLTDLDQRTLTEKGVSFSAVAKGDREGLPILGLQNSFEIMQRLFADLRRGSGATVITSSSGVQVSFEEGEWQNGAFTYAFLYGLTSMQADTNKDKQVTASEIQAFVGEFVPRLTEGLQVPTFRRENLAYDFRVW